VLRKVSNTRATLIYDIKCIVISLYGISENSPAAQIQTEILKLLDKDRFMCDATRREVMNWIPAPPKSSPKYYI
jgi:hypothetical protein